MNTPRPAREMKLSERKIKNRRYDVYEHCEDRLAERYHIRLNINIWLNIHQKYWLREYEHKILDIEHDPAIELVFMPAYGTKLVGLFDRRILFFATFLDNRQGIFGKVIWQNGNIISYG